uniref:Ribosomal protein L19 n=1 Tax=Cyanoptyche gloeocystis TaxID=77922 RepID=A0A3G1IWF5_9EUKA|nr:ribosomal protein L19 [Cyanoptyche gloeocystis]|mmetsp:Transcript_15131/g.25917  ORF Transcript_15131/g.25917 Transcript_15131/m.25917 type:complete len:128 (-) Transcript_15131:538-921(-)
MSTSIVIQKLEFEKIKKDIPEISIGDTVKVGVIIQDGDEKERIQPFEGVVIAKKNTSINTTITVRNILQGIGIERIFLIHSPKISKIEILKRAKVRRAKLYYLRQQASRINKLKQLFINKKKKITKI